MQGFRFTPIFESIQPTYEELKRIHRVYGLCRTFGIQPTYEELKPHGLITARSNHPEYPAYL